MQRKSSQLLLCALPALSALLASCGGGGGSGAPAASRNPTPPPYNKADCRPYQPTDGDAALRSNLSLTRVENEPNFGKPYDRMDLEAVLTASALETSLYVMDMGVSVYRINRVTGPYCPTYFALQNAPSNLEMEWNKIAGTGGEGQLAGLYFEYCAGGCPEFSISNPTILVAEGSDRWTLVHEMMHHNFNASRKADRSIDSNQRVDFELQSGISRIENLVNTYRDRPEKRLLNDLVRESSSLVDWLYKFLVRSSFEEMALESLLLKEYAEGRYKYVGPDSIRSSLWYIEYSRKDGMRRFEAFREIFGLIAKEAEDRFYDDVLTELATVRGKISRIDQETTAVEERARRLAMEVGSGTPFSAGGRSPSFELPHSANVVDEHLKEHIRRLDGDKVLSNFDSAIERVNRAAGAAFGTIKF